MISEVRTDVSVRLSTTTTKEKHKEKRGKGWRTAGLLVLDVNIDVLLAVRFPQAELTVIVHLRRRTEGVSARDARCVRWKRAAVATEVDGETRSLKFDPEKHHGDAVCISALLDRYRRRAMVV